MAASIWMHHLKPCLFSPWPQIHNVKHNTQVHREKCKLIQHGIHFACNPSVRNHTTRNLPISRASGNGMDGAFYLYSTRQFLGPLFLCMAHLQGLYQAIKPHCQTLKCILHVNIHWALHNQLVALFCLACNWSTHPHLLLNKCRHRPYCFLPSLNNCASTILDLMNTQTAASSLSRCWLMAFDNIDESL